MATFKFYTQDYLSQQGDNIQNIAFELMAHCITEGKRLFIEQGKTYGKKYILVDFDTTEHTNEFWFDTDILCEVSSVDVHVLGEIFENFSNYIDAHRWLSDFLRGDNYTTIRIKN